jgi:hypothetical protein
VCGVWCVVCGVCVVGPSQPGHATRDTAISRASTLHCELRRSLRLPPLCHRCRESNPAAQGFWASAARRRPRLVSERFPLTPLQYWLFTPGMQWQSRGQMVYLTGVSTGNARGRHGILRGSGELAAGGETLPSAQRDHAFPLFRVRTAEPWWCVLLPLYAYACAYACAYASAYAYASASALSAWDCTAETGLMMCGVWVPTYGRAAYRSILRESDQVHGCGYLRPPTGLRAGLYCGAGAAGACSRTEPEPEPGG